MITQIYIDGKRLDLFEDENIELKSAIGDVSDIKVNRTDFTRSFTVPASPRNNKIFKHYYNANIDNSFDARTKVRASIFLSGVPYKVGKIKLIKVRVKSGKPDNYSIHFVGNLIDLQKIIGKDLLSDLDLSAYDHSYDSDTVRTLLKNGASDPDLIYTLNPRKQYYFNNDGNDDTDLPELVNIAYNGTDNLNGIRFFDLSPSLKVCKILEAIESKYDLTFTRDFFGSSEFKGIYQTLINNSDGVTGSDVYVDFDGGDTDYVSLEADTGTFYARNTSASNDKIFWLLRMTIKPSAGYENVSYTLTIEVDGNDEDSYTTTGDYLMSKSLSNNGERTYEVKYKVRSNQEFKYIAFLDQYRNSSIPGEPNRTQRLTTASEATLESNFVVKENISKLKIIDWLTGLLKAFKLVIIPNDDGSFYVDTINRYYAKGKLHDVTKYINFESYDVERGEIFSEINFKFEEPSTILNQQFEKNNSIAYGNEELILKDDDGDPLDGDSYEIEVPFETVVYDRLTDQFDNKLTNIMYAPFVDEDRKPSFPKAHLFYNIPRFLLVDDTMSYFDSNNQVTMLRGSVNTAFHSDRISNPNYSLLFGAEISEWDGGVISNNLYTNHHKKYIDGIFNVRRRNFYYNAVLPLGLATELQLNDVLKINSDYYRIDNYTTNLKTGVTKFKLINSFNDDFSQIVSGGDTINFNGDASTTTLELTISKPEIYKIDNGNGVDWFTVTSGNNNLTVSVTTNLTGNIRTGYITLKDPNRIKSDFDILVFQDLQGLVITSDSNLITSDSNAITSDNG